MNYQNNIKIENNEEIYGVGNFLWEVIKVFFWALVIIVPIRVFLFQPFFVQGASMQPNFENGDYLIINELGYKETDIKVAGVSVLSAGSFKELKRYDIAVFRYPLNQKQFFIKRVIGLPGEKVKVENGKIRIYNDKNPEGFILDESEYLSQTVFTVGDSEVKLEQDQYFVLGDNRKASYDSRAWGAVHKSDVIGKVFIRAWPISKAEIL
ncbi:MAG TPA: signal peptidase I [Candidatus Moranbacteria bacterium]|nr:signal peptidase I [Candidatus Moranbacteria bacterium]HRZ33419.1 signal peptidase I [Candidatus Moranbacteria bacterium]